MQIPLDHFDKTLPINTKMQNIIFMHIFLKLIFMRVWPFKYCKIYYNYFI